MFTQKTTIVTSSEVSGNAAEYPQGGDTAMQDKVAEIDSSEETAQAYVKELFEHLQRSH